MSTAVAIEKKFIIDGAEVIATMSIASRIKRGESDLAARDLLGIYNESHAAWLKVRNAAFAADPTLAELTDTDERRTREEQIVTLMVDHYLDTL
jgi:hypothetical protein